MRNARGCQSRFVPRESLQVVTSVLVLLVLSACGSTRWRMTGQMSTPRYGHTATLLLDGTVLVTGGLDGNGSVLASAERYDPAKKTWSAAGMMSTPRVRHTATLLGNGLVLVTGGATQLSHPFPTTASAQLYDPVNNIWSPAGTMSDARVFHIALKLVDGTVLVMGGGGAASVDSQRTVERFDPKNKTWQPVESMMQPHLRGAAALLDDGTVIIGGGEWYGPERDNPTETVVSESERFNPQSGHWSELALMQDTPKMPAAAVLNDGTVLVTGGRNFNVVRYDRAFLIPNVSPQPHVWRIMATLHERRSNHTATLLNNGDVLVTGGYDFCSPDSCGLSRRSAEQYNLKSNTWTMIDNMFIFRGDHTATLLRDGSVLVVGGFNWYAHTATATAEFYPPQ